MKEDKLLQIHNETKAKLESVVVPSIEELNDHTRASEAIQSMMDSLYGKNVVEVHHDKEDANIVNISFVQPTNSTHSIINIK